MDKLRGKGGAAVLLAILLAVNIAVAWRLFHCEYLIYFSSIEGAFIAYARYLQMHGAGSHWFNLWMSGTPESFVYQPALFRAVALTARVTHWSAAHSYHAVTALGYALGGVTFYSLLWQLSRNRGLSFFGAMLYSLFSPSVLVPAIRGDIGGFFHARRLHALVYYGEGPNVVGLTLVWLALALFHSAITTRTARATSLAALGLGAVVVTSWPSTVVLAMGMVCYLVADFGRGKQRDVLRAALVAVLGYAIACPWALPSTIFKTYGNAGQMLDVPVKNAKYYAAGVTLLVLLLALRLAFAWARVSLAIQFSTLFAAVLCSIVFCVVVLDIRLLPQPSRFHLAAEAALILAVVLAVQPLLNGTSNRFRQALTVAMSITGIFLFIQYRMYARHLILFGDVGKSVEYQEAGVFGALGGEKVYAPGSVSFWLNVFNETPQIYGCCLQSDVNSENRIAWYIIPTGFGDERFDADLSLLWLKAFGAHAVGVSGPGSRETYKAFAHPHKFDGKLAQLWRAGEDAIYSVPQRAPGLARVVPASLLVSKPPENGIDIGELKPFVAALDDASLPLARMHWDGTDHIAVDSDLTADKAVSLAVNYHKGWRATLNGQALSVQADGLGLIALRPNSNGPTHIDLRWSAGAEPWIAQAVSACSVLLALLWMIGGAGRNRTAE